MHLVLERRRRAASRGCRRSMPAYQESGGHVHPEGPEGGRRTKAVAVAWLRKHWARLAAWGDVGLAREKTRGRFRSATSAEEAMGGRAVEATGNGAVGAVVSNCESYTSATYGLGFGRARWR